MAMAAESTDESQIPFAEPLKINGLVDFAPGSIVSRTLLENDAATITMFSFSAGQGLSEHTAPFDAFVQIVEGAGEFRIGDKTVVARTGDILVMPANVPHAVKAAERFKMLLTMLRPKAG
jgi:quercetin dioxygenase-like cupin family protein